MAPPPDSAVSTCFHGHLAFLHRHFPLQSPLSHPFKPSLHSQQQPSSWDCSTIPKLQFPAPETSRAPVSLSRVCMAVAKTVWFSFNLGCHRSYVSLSALNVSPLTQKIFPMWELDPCFNSPNCRWQVQSYSLLFFTLVPSSYRVLYGSIYSFCWSGTPVHSQLVFWMHFCVWRCIPVVAVKRDILHMHLLLHNLKVFCFFFDALM